MTTALICGISGQDGAYLARFLAREKGYRVVGTSRDAAVASFETLRTLGIRDEVEVRSMTLTDFRSVLQVLTTTEPDEVYNLAGQSSVGLSFEQPVETLESVAIGTLNLLESIRFTGAPVRLYNAASSECFGETPEEGADERTPFRPRSPYAVAKATSFWEVANYREAYGIHASSGILFNHESPLRPLRFVTRKVVATACRIARGSHEKLLLGDLDISRDWGWAPEYVEAMWRMLQRDHADDYVIATGETHTLREFVDEVFRALELTFADHVETSDALRRPTEIRCGRANPRKARETLDWSATVKMKDVVRLMVEADMRLHSGGSP